MPYICWDIGHGTVVLVLFSVHIARSHPGLPQCARGEGDAPSVVFSALLICYPLAAVEK